MKQPPKRIVAVKIQGREYRIRAEADPETVQRAAALLDETMDRVRLRAGTVDSVDIAVLAALNIANSLVAQRDAKPAGAIAGDRLESLIELIEAAVGSVAPQPR